MRITIETGIDPAVTEAFLPIYHESFAHLAELAASKQVLSDTDFRTVMASPEVLKFSGWTQADKLCAIALATPKLDLVPWVSPPFFAKRFPDHYERGVIYYFLALLVHEENRDESWATAILEAISLFCGARQGVTVFDCCTFNNDVVKLPEIIIETGRRCLDLDAYEIDTQHYHALVLNRIRTIDLRNVRHREVIDLTVHDRSTAVGAEAVSRPTGVRR